MNNAEHIKADLLLLGYTDYRIHGMIDYPARYMGASHRQLYHNTDFLRFVRAFLGRKAFNVALLHLLIDNDTIDRREVRKSLKRYKKVIE